MTIADIIEVQQVKILQQTEFDIDLGTIMWICVDDATRERNLDVRRRLLFQLIILHLLFCWFLCWRKCTHIHTHRQTKKFCFKYVDVCALWHFESWTFFPVSMNRVVRDVKKLWPAMYLYRCPEFVKSRAPDKVQIKLTTNQSS